ADETCAGAAEAVDGAEVAGTIDDDRVAGIDEASSEQIEALLCARDDEHVVRGAAESLADGLPEARLAFGRAETPGGGAVARENRLGCVAKFSRRKQLERGLACGEREQARVRG